LWQSLTSHVRSSSAMAPRLPDADQIASLRLAGRGISRFPCNELPHMPGSSTTPGPPGARAYAPVCIAFRLRNGVSTRNMNLCGAQWLAYVLLCRRFAAAFAGDRARLGVDVDRYSFIVSDLHRLLIAGLPAHCERRWTLPYKAVGAVFGLTPAKASVGRERPSRRTITVGRRDDADDALRSGPKHAGACGEVVLAQGLGDEDRQASRDEEGDR